MAQSGFTPIVTYNTATASAAPVAGNLQQGELAVNVTDKKLYTKDSGGNVVNVGVGADATATLTNKTLTSPVLSNPSYSGTTANGGTVTTIDINGGTIDATAIGSTTPAAGSFTTLRSTVTLGYGTGAGAGGTVKQATSKSTAVTLHKACGQITMNNSAVGAGAEDGFYFYSDKLSANDVLLVTGQHDGTVNPADYEITVRQIYGPTNRALIYIKNRTAGSLSEAVVLNFVIIKGSAS